MFRGLDAGSRGGGGVESLFGGVSLRVNCCCGFMLRVGGVINISRWRAWGGDCAFVPGVETAPVLVWLQHGGGENDVGEEKGGLWLSLLEHNE